MLGAKDSTVMMVIMMAMVVMVMTLIKNVNENGIDFWHQWQKGKVVHDTLVQGPRETQLVDGH